MRILIHVTLSGASAYTAAVTLTIVAMMLSAQLKTDSMNGRPIHIHEVTEATKNKL